MVLWCGTLARAGTWQRYAQLPRSLSSGTGSGLDPVHHPYVANVTMCVCVCGGTAGLEECVCACHDLTESVIVSLSHNIVFNCLMCSDDVRIAGTAVQVCVLMVVVERQGWNVLVIPHVASHYTHPVVSFNLIYLVSNCFHMENVFSEPSHYLLKMKTQCAFLLGSDSAGLWRWQHLCSWLEAGSSRVSLLTFLFVSENPRAYGCQKTTQIKWIMFGKLWTG